MFRKPLQVDNTGSDFRKILNGYFGSETANSEENVQKQAISLNYDLARNGQELKTTKSSSEMVRIFNTP